MGGGLLSAHSNTTRKTDPSQLFRRVTLRDLNAQKGKTDKQKQGDERAKEQLSTRRGRRGGEEGK